MDQLMLYTYAFATRFLSSPETDLCNFIEANRRCRVRVVTTTGHRCPSVYELPFRR